MVGALGLVVDGSATLQIKAPLGLNLYSWPKPVPDVGSAGSLATKMEPSESIVAPAPVYPAPAGEPHCTPPTGARKDHSTPTGYAGEGPAQGTVCPRLERG
jgi:hypothetical protein